MTAAELEAAQARAWETLREHCTPAQRASLDASRTFEAVAPGGRRYGVACYTGEVTVRFGTATDRAHPMYQNWVATVRGRYCQLPVGDLALLVKLSIENAEQHWLQMALMCGIVWVEDPAAQLAREQGLQAAFYQELHRVRQPPQGQPQPAQPPGPGGFDPVAVGGIRFIR